MCNCIKEVEEKVLAQLNSKPEYAKNPVENVTMDNVVFLMEPEFMQVLKTDLKLHIKGRKTPKRTTFTFPYCPICGEAYQPD